MSDLSPYLNTGVVQLGAPAHRQRRQELNPAFTHGSVRTLTGQITDVVARCLPSGPFDAVAWSAMLMREILGVSLLGGRVRPELLADFLGPLDRALPAPFLRRPILFRRMNEAMRDCITHAPAGTLASAFRDLPNGPQELRVAVSAGYDTTAHTLAFLLGHVAQQPELLAAERHASVINEVLRLYPAGWVGSRRCTADAEFCGHRIRARNAGSVQPLSHPSRSSALDRPAALPARTLRRGHGGLEFPSVRRGRADLPGAVVRPAGAEFGPGRGGRPVSCASRPGACAPARA